MSDYIERYWRDATPADAISEPPMVARFRDDDGRWIEKNFRLLGWSRLGTRNNDCLWYSDGVGCYKECQVYDAPDPGEGWRLIDPEKESPEEGDEFFEHGYWKTRRAKTDPFAKTFYYRRRIQPPKPEPGEGWRLIDPEKDKPQEGDEYREKWHVAWKPRNELSTTLFAPETFYRRRIEPPKPEPRYEPFRWEDREQLRGRLITFVDHNRTVEFRCESFEVDDNMFTVNNAYADWLCKHAVFVDTKEPVGKKVMK